MFRLRTEAYLGAPPEVAWRVLSDFSLFPAWNPLLLEAKGEVRPGARVAMKVRAPGSTTRSQRFTATLTRVEPGRALEWTGGVPGVLFGRHYLLLAPEGAGTRLVHGEDFSGGVSWLMGRGVQRRFQAAYEGMNRALAERVEAELVRPTGSAPS